MRQPLRTAPSSPARPGAILLLALLLSLAAPGLARAQDHAHEHQEGEHLIGEVEFPTSCAPAAQDEFQRGLAMLHSFWFGEARQAFERAADADATCAIAHWGIATTQLGNPMARSAPSQAMFDAGSSAAARALELSENANARERGYIAAIAAYYRDAEGLGHFQRMARYEEALGALHRAHPDDPEAAIFYAMVVVANAPPTDMSFERQIHGASILAPLFEARPNHPGLAHYIIHAFDSPALAERGLEAARRYADIAPSAPHALHMPSHIFTRLGYWQESAEMNERSADAESNPRGRYHPWDYMVYAYLQQGRDEQAREVVEEAWRVEREAVGADFEGYTRSIVAYNLAAMPARYALERGAWDEAAGLELFPSVPYVEALTRFARGIGSARGGGAAAAEEEARRLGALAEELAVGDDSYWATVVGAQALAVSSWAMLARGEADDALRLAREAADLEETVEKHPVTPGPILPARELLGEMLLEVDRPADALAEFARTLEREPNRARTLYGAGRAAEADGRSTEAERFYRALVDVMAPGDGGRAELRRARSFLSARG